MADDEGAAVGRLADGAGCPVCGKPRALAYRPFCCKRCADLDLHKWLNNSYAIPAVETDDDEDGLVASHHASDDKVERQD